MHTEAATGQVPGSAFAGSTTAKAGGDGGPVSESCAWHAGFPIQFSNDTVCRSVQSSLPHDRRIPTRSAATVAEARWCRRRQPVWYSSRTDRSGGAVFNRFALIFAVSVLAASECRAKTDDVRIVSMILGDGLQMADGSGFYGDLAAAVLARSNAPARVTVLPFKRALQEFFSQRADCIWGLDEALLRQFRDHPQPLVESALVLDSLQYLFLLPGQPRMRDLGDIRGRSVGVLNGANTIALFRSNRARVVELPNEETKVRMLLSGRLDAIGGWMPDLYITINRMKLDPAGITPALKLDRSGVRFVCHDHSKNLSFLEHANGAIETFLDSDAYARILRKFGVPSDFEW